MKDDKFVKPPAQGSVVLLDNQGREITRQAYSNETEYMEACRKAIQTARERALPLTRTEYRGSGTENDPLV